MGLRTELKHNQVLRSDGVTLKGKRSRYYQSTLDCSPRLTETCCCHPLGKDQACPLPQPSEPAVEPGAQPAVHTRPPPHGGLRVAVGLAPTGRLSHPGLSEDGQERALTLRPRLPETWVRRGSIQVHPGAVSGYRELRGPVCLPGCAIITDISCLTLRELPAPHGGRIWADLSSAFQHAREQPRRTARPHPRPAKPVSGVRRPRTALLGFRKKKGAQLAAERRRDDDLDRELRPRLRPCSRKPASSHHASGCAVRGPEHPWAAPRQQAPTAGPDGRLSPTNRAKHPGPAGGSGTARTCWVQRRSSDGGPEPCSQSSLPCLLPFPIRCPSLSPPGTTRSAPG
uniref:uncharacterized protein LOC129496465 n=1 Tax=Nyctereutes procyonoides TaxID=34880 RepID=UPI002443D508|nr:uncharacterized protein LOC129496465 [Nyctereutes procyonoides]